MCAAQKHATIKILGKIMSVFCSMIDDVCESPAFLKYDMQSKKAQQSKFYGYRNYYLQV